jgi:RNA polymerase sigma-70 factor (ECF subfamily)
MAASATATSEAGEPGAPPVEDWSVFYDAHFDYVWRSLRRLGVRESSLDDAAQEVFVVALRRQGQFEGRSSIRTWLFGIALNRSRELARSERRRAEDELPDYLPDPSERDQEQRAMDTQALRLVYHALDELTEERRALLIMAEVEEMTASEIADLLSIPVNTVYSRIRLARRDFEVALKRVRARAPWRAR